MQVCFEQGDDFGCDRAFHNVDLAATKTTGYRVVSHTVQAMEPTVSVNIFDEFHVENDEFYIENDDGFIENDELSIENDEFRIDNDD